MTVLDEIIREGATTTTRSNSAMIYRCLVRMSVVKR